MKNKVKKNIQAEVEKEYQTYLKNRAIIETARALLDEYGESDKIPIEKLQGYDFDDAELLAHCKLIEKYLKELN